MVEFLGIDDRRVAAGVGVAGERVAHGAAVDGVLEYVEHGVALPAAQLRAVGVESRDEVAGRDGAGAVLVEYPPDQRRARGADRPARAVGAVAADARPGAAVGRRPAALGAHDGREMIPERRPAERLSQGHVLQLSLPALGGPLLAVVLGEAGPARRDAPADRRG